MILNPLRFQSADELSVFLTRLEAQGLIKNNVFNHNRIVPAISSESLAQNFLLTDDGNNIYFLEEVKQFLQQATDEEIDAAGVVFSTTHDQSVTLAQIKADKSLLSQLKGYSPFVQSLRALNPSLYSSKSLPEMNSMTDIETVKSALENEVFFSALSRDNLALSLGRAISSINTLGASLMGNYLLPKFIKSSELILDVQRDILRITLLQEAKLKSYLLNARTKFTNQDEIDGINQWIARIDQNNSNIKEIFQQLLDRTKQIRDNAVNAKSEYQGIIKADPTLEKIKKYLENLKNKEKRLASALKWQKPLFKVLKPIAVYGLLVGVPVLATTALFVSLALFALLAPGFALMVMSIAVGGLLGAIFNKSVMDKVVESVSWLSDIITSIENIFDTEEKLCNAQMKVQEVQNKITCVEEFSKLSEKEKSTDHYTDLIEMLESDLIAVYLEIPEPRKEQNAERPSKAPSSANVAIDGLFGQQRPVPFDDKPAAANTEEFHPAAVQP